MAFSMSGRVVWHHGAFIEILIGTARDRMMRACHRDARGNYFRPNKTWERCLEDECPMETSPANS